MTPTTRITRARATCARRRAWWGTRPPSWPRSRRCATGASRQKIMAVSRRVDRTAAPRATHLRRLSRELGEKRGEPQWYEISRQVEQTVKADKGLYANVDFYSASTYHNLGIPTDLFTPVFAISRMSGWTAHVLEQYGNNRLIRPRAEYVGPRHVPYTPLDER